MSSVPHCSSIRARVILGQGVEARRSRQGMVTWIIAHRGRFGRDTLFA